jgi:hypothetical protein
LCLCVVALGGAAVSAAASIARVAPTSVHSTRTPAAVDASHHTHVVGDGTAASCTSAAVVAAVQAGGSIHFACGPHPVTIAMLATAKVMNTSSRVVLDGGGRVTLSGGGLERILYMDTCDQAQVWTTPHCQDQSSPELVVKNLKFKDGNSTGETFDGGGGGAIFARGGQLRIVNDTFSANRCDPDGPDIGGGAVRALSQYNNLPVLVINSRFNNNVCSNGGALSSIGVSWTVRNSRFTGNQAIGTGANPAQSGTPGGGSGGAIYNDGDTMKLSITGSTFVDNHANEGGGAIFFVSDDRSGTMAITHSTLKDNPNIGFHTAGLPGIFFLGAQSPSITSSVLQ